MEWTTLLSVVLIATFLTVLLRQYRPEWAIAVGMITGVVVILRLLQMLEPPLSELRAMLEGASLPSAYTAILFKALGICLLTQLSADTCRDAGETALAAKAEWIGKLFLLVLSVPLFEEIVAVALSLIQE